MKLRVFKVVTFAALPLALSSCASMGSGQDSSSNAPVHFQPAVNQNLVKTKVVTQYVPVPVPGQLKYLKSQGKGLKRLVIRPLRAKKRRFNTPTKRLYVIQTAVISSIVS
ncbi:hypothetical protein [Piscirickettsia litoralis]|uniref:hypothetical protein n=1 Tax=Piscirickettsia litoralis TaxID=1891921 RepID=UPI001F2D41BB|nr:hypothetical protein [Piscirickettsia litoralis]